MARQKIPSLFLKGIIISLIFCFPVISQAKDIDIGLPGDSINILGTNLCLSSSCIDNWNDISGSWVTNGTSIYYNTGNVGIGISNPAAALDVYRTEPFRTRGQVVFGGSAYIGSGDRLLMVDNVGNVIATTMSEATGLPSSSTSGQTLRSNGTSWIATSNLYNNGTNVGVGITNPLSTLNVSGTLAVNQNSALAYSSYSHFAQPNLSTTFSNENIYDRASYDALSVGLRDNTLGSNYLSALKFLTYTGGTNGARIIYAAPGTAGLTSGLHFYVGSGAMSHTANFYNGRLGVGTSTSTPAYTLDVFGNANFNDVALGVTPGTSQTLALTTVEYVNNSITGANNPTVGYWTADGNNIFNSNTGNIGLGVTAPTQKLDVAGNIQASGYIRGVTIQGTVDTAAATLAKVATIPDYTPTAGDLLAITFTLGNSVSYPTLDINGTGAKNIRLNNSNANTTNFYLAAGATVLMYYDGAYYQIMGSQRTSDSTTDANMYFNINKVMGAALYDYKIIAEGDDGRYYPLTLEEGTGTTKTITTRPLKMGGNIFYYNGTTNVAENAVVSNTYSELNIGTMHYTFNQSGGYTNYQPIYLVGTIDSNGYFVLDNSSSTSFYTQTLPSTEDGKVYIYLGQVYSTNNMRLTLSHPAYEYKNGRVQLYIPDKHWSGLSGGNIWSLNASNVGIGKTNPAYKLDVSGTANFDGLAYGVTPGETQTLALSTVEYVNAKVGGSAGITTGTTGQTLRHDGTGWVANSTLYNNGTNVGVGTTGTSQKLTVEGNILVNNRLTTPTNVSLSLTPNGSGNVYFGDAGNGANIYHYSNSDNGVYSIFSHDASGNYEISVTGTGMLKLLENTYISGNVGIGTTSPTDFLSIVGSSTTGLSLNSTGGSAYRLLSLPLGHTYGQGFLIYDGSVRLKINDSTGNIGVGKFDPVYKLDVAGTANFDGLAYGVTPGTTQTLALTTVEYVNSMVSGASTSTVGYWSANGTNIYNANGGNVGIGTTAPGAKLAITGTYGNMTLDGIDVTFNRASKNYITAKSVGGYLAFQTNGNNDRMTIDTLGNVGIGATNPSSRLEVYGGGIKVNDDGYESLYISDKDTVNGIFAGQVSTLSYGFIGYNTRYNASYQFNPVSSTASHIIFDGSRIHLGVDSGLTAGTNYIPSKLLTIVSSGNIGISTTAPTQKLHVNGGAQLDAVSFGVTPGESQTLALTTVEYVNSKVGGSSGIAAGTTGQTLRHDGTGWVANSVLYNNGTNIGIGATNPGSLLTIANNQWMSAINSTDTGIVNMFKVNTNNQIEVGAPLLIGPLEFAADSGLVSFLDMPVTSGALVGTPEGYSMKIDGNNLLTVYAESDGAGGIQNSGVGIGTNSPRFALDVEGNIALTGTNFLRFGNGTYGEWGIQNNSSNDLNFAEIGAADGRLYLKAGGNIGIGKTSPVYKLDVAGTANFDGLAYGVTPGTTQTLALTTVEYVNNMVSGATQPTVGYWTASGNDIYNANSGNVGIGVSVPSQKFDVSGVVNATGFRVNNATATAGQYLRGNGTNFVASTIQASDVPTLNQNTTGYAGFLLREDNRTISPSELTSTRMKFGFTSYNNNSTSPWADFLHMRSYQDSSGGNDNLLVFNKAAIGMRLYQQTYGSATAYTTYKDVLMSDNSPVVNYLTKYTVAGTAVSVGKSIVYDNGTNIGIGTTAPTQKLHVNGIAQLDAVSFGVTPGSGQTLALATVEYVNATVATGSYLPITGGTMQGPINMGGFDITNVNKLTAGTVDPLYRIKGVNYSTFAPSVVGGVKEEYVGKIEISDRNNQGEYEAIIDFSKAEEGSDLWVWYQVVDFSQDNINVLITPYGSFANTYYQIEGDKIIIRANRPVKASYRLIGQRHDWKEWPTKAKDQNEKPSFIID